MKPNSHLAVYPYCLLQFLSSLMQSELEYLAVEEVEFDCDLCLVLLLAQMVLELALAEVVTDEIVVFE